MLNFERSKATTEQQARTELLQALRKLGVSSASGYLLHGTIHELKRGDTYFAYAYNRGANPELQVSKRVATG